MTKTELNCLQHQGKSRTVNLWWLPHKA